MFGTVHCLLEWPQWKNKKHINLVSMELMHSIQTRFWEYLRDSEIGGPGNYTKRVVQGQHIPFSSEIGRSKSHLPCSRMISKILEWLGDWKYHANACIMLQGLVVVTAIIGKTESKSLYKRFAAAEKDP